MVKKASGLGSLKNRCSTPKVDERTKIMLDATPLCCELWDEHYNIIDCNQEAVNLFELSGKEEYLNRFFELSPKYQPNGSLSRDEALIKIQETFKTGRTRFEWMHQKLNGEPIPSETTMVRVERGDEPIVAAYTHDLRALKASRIKEAEANERALIMLDATPLCCSLWDEQFNTIDCNQEAVNLFGLSSKEEYLARFNELSPEYQPSGKLSADEAYVKIKEAFETGRTRFEWMHQTLTGEPIAAEITLVRVKHGNAYIVAGYTRDLREIKTSQIQADEANERTRIMLDATPLCCNLWDENFNNIDCNQEAVNLFELSNKQEYLDRFFELSPKYQPDGQLTADKALKNIKEAFKTGRIRFEWMHQKLNGDPIPSEITLVRVKRGDVYIVAGYTRDLRELKASQAIADEANERTRIMFESTPLCCNFWDENFNNIDCNQEAVNLFGLSSKQEYLDRFNDLSPEYQPDGQLSKDKALLKIIKEAFETGRTRFEWMHQKLNGDPVPSEITLVRVRRGDRYIVVGYTRDLRELKETVAMLNQLENIAFTDSLTGAYNRRYFIKKAEAEFQAFASTKKFIAIIMFDLDKFKLVNDTYGHPAGDEVLKSVTSVVQRTLRAEDLFARYGGEEFIILIRNMNQETVARLAARIKDRVANSISNYKGTEIKITVSLGIAMRSERVTSLDDVIKKADEALYKAKANGRNRVEIYLEEEES